eukprot:1178933-Prymnesium_polylepis.1
MQHALEASLHRLRAVLLLDLDLIPAPPPFGKEGVLHVADGGVHQSLVARLLARVRAPPHLHRLGDPEGEDVVGLPYGELLHVSRALEVVLADGQRGITRVTTADQHVEVDLGIFLLRVERRAGYLLPLVAALHPDALAHQEVTHADEVELQDGLEVIGLQVGAETVGGLEQQGEDGELGRSAEPLRRLPRARSEHHVRQRLTSAVAAVDVVNGVAALEQIPQLGVPSVVGELRLEHLAAKACVRPRLDGLAARHLRPTVGDKHGAAALRAANRARRFALQRVALVKRDDASQFVRGHRHGALATVSIAVRALAANLFAHSGPLGPL